MTRKTNDDILRILDEVHGNPQSDREATLDVAVQRVEAALGAYTALQHLSQNGTPTTAPETPPDAAEPEKTGNPPEVVVVSGLGADFKEAGHTKTFIIRRPKTPNRR